MIVFEQVVRGDEKKWIFFIHENNFIFSSPPWRFFSQESEKTAINFRDYAFRHPNRTVLYQLASDIQQKLSALISPTEFRDGIS